MIKLSCVPLPSVPCKLLTLAVFKTAIYSILEKLFLMHQSISLFFPLFFARYPKGPSMFSTFLPSIPILLPNFPIMIIFLLFPHQVIHNLAIPVKEHGADICEFFSVSNWMVILMILFISLTALMLPGSFGSIKIASLYLAIPCSAPLHIRTLSLPKF